MVGTSYKMEKVLEKSEKQDTAYLKGSCKECIDLCKLQLVVGLPVNHGDNMHRRHGVPQSATHAQVCCANDEQVQLTRQATQHQQLWVIQCPHPEGSGQHKTPHKIHGRGTVQFQGVVSHDENCCTLQNYTIWKVGASYKMLKIVENVKLDKTYPKGSISPAHVLSSFIMSSSNKHLDIVHKGRILTPGIHRLHHPVWMDNNEPPSQDQETEYYHIPDGILHNNMGEVSHQNLLTAARR
jgi:hypothetical protein